MKFSTAIQKYATDQTVRELNAARIACNRAGCYDEEFSILQKLVARLRGLSGMPIVIGV